MTTQQAARGLGRRDYAERKASRLERLEARSVKLRAESEARLSAANRLASAIPMGQPILVGHHSEKRHRRDVARIDSNMRRGVEAQKAAESCERRAAAAEGNRAISSDDPEAVVQLKEKLIALSAQQERMRAVNKLIRTAGKNGPNAAEQSLISELGIDPITAETLVRGNQFGDVGYPAYRLQNNSSECRRLEKRISQLQRAAELPEVRETIGVVELVVADNRVQLHFAGKPAEPVRAELKRAGFRWAPSECAWQRQPTGCAIQEARRIAGMVGT